MISVRSALLGLALAGLATSAVAAEAKWVEGRHYALIKPALPQQVPKGKVEVTEIFSYGCPGCFQFQPVMEKIRASLPANAQLVLVHAAWNKAESWPLFQRSYVTAQALGIAEKNHQAMFNAIWANNGELAVVDSRSGGLKAKQPTIEDVARFYAKLGGVTEEKFLQTAKSFSVNLRIKQSDALIQGYAPPATPTIVVAGKYRIESGMLNGAADFVDLVRFLVQKEAAAGATT